jgi:hypothetical protein
MAQANLVSKLPRDFPFAGWENMRTKEQLRAMQYSGLNAQEQWALLNSNIPLSVLDQHNQVQAQNGSTALAASVAASLVGATAKAAVPPTPTPGDASSNYTPLQRGGLREKLNALKEEYKKTPVGNTSGKVTGKASGVIGGAVPIRGTVGARVGSAIVYPNSPPTITPYKYNIELVTPTPSPRITPTPSPKPTPTPTPKPTANLNMIKQFVADMRNQKNPFYLKYSQDSGDRSDCSTQVFDFYSMKGEKNPLLGVQHETCKSYYEKLHIPPESFIESGGTVWSTVPRDIAKGDTKVPDNWQSTTQFGDMVIWMKDPKYDSGKRLIIESYDDLHIGLCLGNEQMLDRAQWEENNPNGYEEGLFARGLDTINSSYELILIFKPGDEARLTPDDIYNYLLQHQD